MAGRAVCESEMRSAERPGLNPWLFSMVHPNTLKGCSRVRGGGGTCCLDLGLTTAAFVYMPHSAVVSCFESAILRPRGRMMAGDVSDPPQNRGVMRSSHRWHVEHASVPDPMGSLTSSFIPAGRLVKNPLSPRASSCRIGPRRQGFASPLRALDGSGPIRKTRCLRGERGGSGRGARGRASA